MKIIGTATELVVMEEPPSRSANVGGRSETAEIFDGGDKVGDGWPEVLPLSIIKKCGRREESTSRISHKGSPIT